MVKGKKGMSRPIRWRVARKGDSAVCNVLFIVLNIRWEQSVNSLQPAEEVLDCQQSQLMFL